MMLPDAWDASQLCRLFVQPQAAGTPAVGAGAPDWWAPSAPAAPGAGLPPPLVPAAAAAHEQGGDSEDEAALDDSYAPPSAAKKSAAPTHQAAPRKRQARKRKAASSGESDGDWHPGQADSGSGGGAPARRKKAKKAAPAKGGAKDEPKESMRRSPTLVPGELQGLVVPGLGDYEPLELDKEFICTALGAELIPTCGGDLMLGVVKVVLETGRIVNLKGWADAAIDMCQGLEEGQTYIISNRGRVNDTTKGGNYKKTVEVCINQNTNWTLVEE
eukprot:scaffold3.g6406.t1